MTDRVEAHFGLTESGLGDQVRVTLSRPIRVLRFDPETCDRWANALIALGRQAERNQAGHAALSVKEVDALEEALCGRPSLRGG